MYICALVETHSSLINDSFFERGVQHTLLRTYEKNGGETIGRSRESYRFEFLINVSEARSRTGEIMKKVKTTKTRKLGVIRNENELGVGLAGIRCVLQLCAGARTVDEAITVSFCSILLSFQITSAGFQCSVSFSELQVLFQFISRYLLVQFSSYKKIYVGEGQNGLAG